MSLPHATYSARDLWAHAELGQYPIEIEEGREEEGGENREWRRGRGEEGEQKRERSRESEEDRT